MSAVYQTTSYPTIWPLLLSSQQYIAIGVAPHTNTTRITYTNNTYYPALVDYLFLRKSQAIAPSAYGESGIIVLVNGVRHFLDTGVLSATAPFINARHSLNLRLAHGDLVEVQTFDGSTGGTVSWAVVAQIVGV